MNMHPAMSLFFCSLLVSSVAMAAEPLEASKAGVSELLEYRLPPRRIEDVLRLLEHYKPVPEAVQRARDLAAAKPPEGAGKEQLVDFYRRRAMANARLGRVDQQIADLRLAVGHTENSFVRAGLLGSLASAESTGGNLLSAVRTSVEALAQLPPGNPGRQLALLQAAAKYQALLGDLPVASERLRQAEEVFSRLRSSRGWAMRGQMWTAQIQRARAEVFVIEGRYVEAEGAYRKALAAFVDSGQWEGAPEVDGEDRVVRYDGVLERSLSSVLLAQGKLAEAEFFVRRALQKTLERVGRDSVDAAQALALLSNILSEQGRYAEAARLAEASLRAYEESGAFEQSYNLARARQFLGAALAAQGRDHDALAVFERNREILARDPELLKKYGVGHPEWVIALLNSGRAAEAERMASAMLEWTVARFGDGNPRAALRRALIAVARVEQGDFAGANKLFVTSVPELLAQARDDAEAETGSLRKQRYLVFVLEAWLRSLAGGFASEESAAEAFHIADIARSSTVQRALTAAAARSNIGDPELAAIARQEQDAQRRQVSLSNLLVQMLGARPEEQLPRIQENLRRDIARLLAERDALRRQLAERFPDYAELVRPRAVTLARAQASLRAGEVLVTLYVGERESYVWTLSASGARHFSRVPSGREQVAKEVAHLRRALDAGVDSIDALPAFDVAAAHSLYARFLAPSALLWREAKTLIVIPHGALAQLPLSLLPTAPSSVAATGVSRGLAFAGYREEPWLARQVAVQQLPSAVALVSLRRLPVRPASVGSFAGFGDPLFSTRQVKSGSDAESRAGGVLTRGRQLSLRNAARMVALESTTLAQLPPLPDTGQELRAIARALKADPNKDVFLQQDATESRVLDMDRSRDLASRRVVMFATHGLVPGDLDGLTQPALALTSPDVVPGAGNGLLTMDDVLALRMDADWVVLSACNTAAGEGAGAEAVSGLGRAFFYAGARAMLVSNWPVETVSARLLMTEVFKQQGADPSLSKAEALRRSMLALIDGPGAQAPGGKAAYSYAHPMFWAPFVVVGD